MSSTTGKRAGRDLPAAIIVGVVLLSAVILTLKFWHWGFILLVVLMLAGAAVELHVVLKRAGMRSAIVPVVLGIVVMLTGSFAAATGVGGPLPWYSVLLACLAATVLLSLISRMPGGHEGFIKDASASLFLVGYLALMGAFIPLMLAGESGAARIAAYLLCVVASDTGGYVAGVLFGKHKMAPTISPKKTWEGFAGSTIFAVVVGALMANFFLGVHWWVGVLLGLVGVTFGTCGDLIESLIKRDIGIKDMSSILPGHGGLMDRIDALLIAAPPSWLLLYLLVPGG